MCCRKSCSLRVWLAVQAANLPRDNIKIEHESECAVPDIFKLTPLHFTWQHRQIRMFAFQCLNARHFIHTFNALALFGQFRSLFVQPVDIADFVIKIGFIGRCQPITIQMRLDISFFLKASPHVEERCLSTILRFFSSSAISRAVQCVIGRSDFSGFSQARASIWQR